MTIAFQSDRLGAELAAFLSVPDRPPRESADRLWDELRTSYPIVWNGPHLILSRHEDVKAILRDPRFGKDGADSTEAAAVRARLAPEDAEIFDELVAFESTWMVRAPTAEQHDRLRRVAHRAFTPRHVDAMRHSVERHVAELLRPLEQGGLVDFTTISYRLPLAMITDLLGVPAADRESVHEWTGRLSAALNRDPERMRVAVVALREFKAYVLEIADEHRRSPESVSPLVAAMLDAEQQERLTPSELAGLFVQLLFAGHETATTLIEQGLIELMYHREQWELLCAEPDLAANAVEELLRWVPPIPSMFRVAYADCDVLGVPIRAGQSVRVLIASANRDPSVFADPDRLDLRRSDAKEHLSFGFGPRFCLGASLARLEVATVLGTLARRFPGLELGSDELAAQRGAGLRTLDRLPVKLPA